MRTCEEIKKEVETIKALGDTVLPYQKAYMMNKLKIEVWLDIRELLKEQMVKMVMLLNKKSFLEKLLRK